MKASERIEREALALRCFLRAAAALDDFTLHDFKSVAFFHAACGLVHLTASDPEAHARDRALELVQQAFAEKHGAGAEET